MAMKWGSTYGSGNGQARLGINVELEVSATEVKRTLEIWIWNRYKWTDTNNTLYYTCTKTATSAKNSRDSVTVSTPSNTSWSDSNKKKLKTYTITYDREETDQVYKAYAKLTGLDYVGETLYVNTSITIPALDTYEITYDANGGTGAPSKQTKTYGKAINLRTGVPTKEGHKFLGWSTSKTATSASYQPGAEYKKNADLKLYAVWSECDYVLTLNANGGTMENDSYGLKYDSSDQSDLSANIPIKYGFKFLGWFTAAEGGVKVYNESGLCTNEGTYWKNNKYVYAGDLTLYAHWELTATLIVGDKKPAMPMVYVDGEWRKAYAHIYKNGKWNTGIT